MTSCAPNRRFISLCLPLFSLFLIPFFPLQVSAQDADGRLFRYKQNKGEVYHISANVDELVLINGVRSHQAQIEESATLSVLEVDSDNTARLDASFRTTERIAGLPGFHEWLSEERVALKRDALGRMTVSEDSARPVLRGVPTFPSHPVEPGDSWTAPAQEVHVFRLSDGMAGPYKADTQVQYRYINDAIQNGRELALLEISYDMVLPVRESGSPIRLVSGRSRQELLWNINDGHPESKTEDFEFFVTLASGDTLEFVGTQTLSYRRSELLDRPATAARLRDTLTGSGIEGVRSEITDDGVKLVIVDGEKPEHVLFSPESSVVRPEQRTRLEVLKPLLEAYTDRDVVITGHTALAGTVEGRHRLSLERAAAVAEVLFPGGRSGPGRLWLRGAGATEPLSSETTEAARAQNRRVEILILD